MSILFSSCLGSKFLKENEQLLVKEEIKGLSGQLEDNAKELYEQEPNSKPLGIFSTPLPFSHLAWIYQLGLNGSILTKPYDPEKISAKRDLIISKYTKKINQTDKKKKKQKLKAKMAKKTDKQDKKLKEGNQLMRWGEELSVYDHNNTKTTASKIKQYLNSKGYFNSKVDIDTSFINPKKRTVSLTFEVDRGNQYHVDSIEYIIPDQKLRSLVMDNLLDAPLEKGYYDQEMLTEERDHIYHLAVNNGYYEFSKQFVQFEIDSTQSGNDILFIREVIRNPKGKDQHKIFYLDSIVLVTDASLSSARKRTTEYYKDITFSFGRNKYSQKILEWHILLEQDDRYSREFTIETQRQLSYLDNFKFVNINYDTTGRRFIANIFTSPFDKYQTSSEAGVVFVGKYPGPFFNINLKNRNTFRALEIISLDVNAKVEALGDVSGMQNRNYSSLQYGGELSFNFPQFLFPLGRYYKKKIRRFNPKTRFAFGLAFEDRFQEYARRIFNTSFSYSWQIRDEIKYTLTPLQVSFIDSKITSDNFRKFLQQLEDSGNTYANAFQSSFVSSVSFQLDLSLGGYAKGEDGFFARLYTELGGSPNNLFGERALGDSLEQYHYVKSNIDIRKIAKINRRLDLAYRFNIGAGIPFGDNNSLPYEKYFFAGGSSSLRAWKPRRLGPGAFGITEENSNRIDYTREQPGEFVIESSVELRQDLVGFLEGAFFVDAGNTWLLKGTAVKDKVRKDPQEDDGKFRFDSFLSEIAVGAGVGLRFDFSFLIFRFDLGVKLVDPALPPGKRFVGLDIFKKFRNNSEFNIGIGYPF